MQRYFVNQDAELNQRFFITDENDVHHMTHVMRFTTEDEIIVTCHNQRVFRCQIVNIDGQGVEVYSSAELSNDTELPVHVTICSGLLKADKYEWLLQKSTELGATAFYPTQMERSVVKLSGAKVDKKVARWQKIVKEAAEQSYRLIVPEIAFQTRLTSVLQHSDDFDYILIAYEDAAKQGETEQLKAVVSKVAPGSRILFVFGPEGGLSEAEVASFGKRAHTVGLGPRILRAETAPLYALSALSYALELK